MRPSFLLLQALFTATAIAVNYWDWLGQSGGALNSAVDGFQVADSSSQPDSLSAPGLASDTLSAPDFSKQEKCPPRKIFAPQCAGLHSLCCTGTQTPDYSEDGGRFFVDQCEKYTKGSENCNHENTYCCQIFITFVIPPMTPQGVKCIPAQGDFITV